MSNMRAANVILREAGAQTARQYGGIVFRCLLEAEGAATLRLMIQRAFEFGDVGTAYMTKVKERINEHFPCDEDQDEEACVLPPLFFQSDVDNCYGLASNLCLIAFASGPVFPVVRIHTSANVLNDPSLSHNVFEIYEAMATFHVSNEPTHSVQAVFDAMRSRKAVVAPQPQQVPTAHTSPSRS
jgi:hypothetical protein